MSRAEPLWLAVPDVLALHQRLLHEHGGAPGVRDLGLLESALARPRNQFGYGEADLCLLASAYAAGIIRNHPFVDGNKRTAFLTAFVFLGLNRNDLRADEAEVVRVVLALTDKTLSEAEFAAWLRMNVKPHAARTTKARPRKSTPRRRQRGRRGKRPRDS